VVLFVRGFVGLGGDRRIEDVSHQLFPSLFDDFVGTTDDVCWFVAAWAAWAAPALALLASQAAYSD
jgi:hypothetical protein